MSAKRHVEFDVNLTIKVRAAFDAKDPGFTIPADEMVNVFIETIHEEFGPEETVALDDRQPELGTITSVIETSLLRDAVVTVGES